MVELFNGIITKDGTFFKKLGFPNINWVVFKFKNVNLIPPADHQSDISFLKTLAEETLFF